MRIPPRAAESKNSTFLHEPRWSCDEAPELLLVSIVIILNGTSGHRRMRKVKSGISKKEEVVPKKRRWKAKRRLGQVSKDSLIESRSKNGSM